MSVYYVCTSSLGTTHVCLPQNELPGAANHAGSHKLEGYQVNILLLGVLRFVRGNALKIWGGAGTAPPPFRRQTT
jgi:hypothetical protein